jgi:hypothetical protein
MLAVLLVLWFSGWQNWLAVLAAAVIAWLISYAMFGSLHDAAAAQMERWFIGRAGRGGSDEDAEDAEIASTPRRRKPA